MPDEVEQALFAEEVVNQSILLGLHEGRVVGGVGAVARVHRLRAADGPVTRPHAPQPGADLVVVKQPFVQILVSRQISVGGIPGGGGGGRFAFEHGHGQAVEVHHQVGDGGAAQAVAVARLVHDQEIVVFGLAVVDERHGPEFFGTVCFLLQSQHRPPKEFPHALVDFHQ